MSNTMDLRHPEYVAMSESWERCRDVVSGQDAIHKAREKYLPRLAVDEGDEQAYRDYVRRAGWYGATSRTISNMMGMVFRNDPRSSLDAIDASWLDDITLAGVSLDGFAHLTLEATLAFGRGATLLDYPRMPDGVITRAQAEAAQLRPYWAWYDAGSVINWRFERMGGRYQLSLVVLREVDAIESDFGFSAHGARVTYRVCRLRASDNGALMYTQQVATVESADGTAPAQADVVDGAELQWSEELPVVVNGATLERIPLYWFNANENDTVMPRPPLLDLVDKNIEYYQVTAQHRHGMHWTALPTPWVTGLRDEEAEVVTEIGPRRVWRFSDSQARVGLLEYTGAGLGTLRDERESIKDEMAKLGARVLATSTTTRIRTATEIEADVGAETSQLTRIVRRVSAQMTAMLRETARWAGADDAAIEEVDYELNTDYVDARMASTALTALVAAWQSGAISRESLLWNLKDGEMLPPERSIEDEMEAIENDPGGGVGVLGEAAE